MKKVTDRYLKIACFLLPIALALSAFLIEGNVGLSGLFFAFDGFIASFWFLKSSRKVKLAAWSYVIGFIVACTFLFIGAWMNLSGQPSPWLH